MVLLIRWLALVLTLAFWTGLVIWLA
jgi:hypothetical protein